MASLLSFLPLRTETALSIRARMESDLNAGKDPESNDYYDTTEGGPTSDILQTFVLEAERLWDMAAVDMVAASMIEFAWGDYLDDHGETVNLPRLTAVRSTGELTFTGDDGTMIGIGTEASTVQTDPEVDAVVFQTTESGTIASGTLTLACQAVEPGVAGNVAAAAVSLMLTGVDGVAAVTNELVISGGSEDETDEAYRERLKLEYSLAQGAGSVDDYKRWSLSYAGVGHVRVVPLWNGPGSVRVVITDSENNPVSDTIEDGLQNLLDPFSAETLTSGSHSLPVATITVDSTTGFATAGRIMVGEQLVTYTGVTSTTFTGCTGGTGVQADDTLVVQQGEGQGLAPVGAIVTVDTPASLTVNISATVTYDDGYSDDGAGGTIGLQTEIEEALSDYVDALGPGGENPPGAESPAGSGYVLLNRVESRFFDVEGVYNVSSVQINAVAADLAVATLQVPVLGTVTLVTVLEEKAELMLADMPPYLADDLYVQDIIGAAANELQLIDDFIAEVREKLRPQNSDDTYRLLGLWEAFLGLPVEPEATSLSSRRSRVLAAVKRRRAGAGAGWVELITLVLNSGAWTHTENDPDDYELTLEIPFPSTSFAAGGTEQLLRDVSPAHLQITIVYSDSFRVGISEVGDTL